jgi:hypothetical protein
MILKLPLYINLALIISKHWIIAMESNESQNNIIAIISLRFIFILKNILNIKVLIRQTLSILILILALTF